MNVTQKQRIALVDCNNFFVSCERLFRPDLWHKPVAVLSNNDGCVVARSEQVKDLGVSMGVPLYQVKNVVEANSVQLFSANFELYANISQRIVTILQEVCPRIEVYSIDECFLDITKLNLQDEQAWCEQLRQRLLDEVGMPVSIGVADTKTLAKAANHIAKKQSNGVAIIDNATTRQAVLRQLPIDAIWGIGRRLAPKLQEKGVTNAWQLVSASDNWLASQFNVTGLKMIDELRAKPRHGFGDKHDKRQSIMRSRSFSHRVRDYYQLEAATASFTVAAATKLRQQGSVCGAVLVSLLERKNDRWRRVNQLVSLDEPTADSGRLINAALSGLELAYDEDFAYQKSAVTLLDIKDQSVWQLSLTKPDGRRDKHQRLMLEVDKINRRFGNSTVSYAVENKLNSTWQSKRQLRSPSYTTKLAELPKLSLLH